MVSEKRAVLLVGPIARIGIPVARALAAHGIRVSAALLSPQQRPIPSRSIQRYVRLPDPGNQGDFIARLVRVIEEDDVGVLMPCSDMALRAIADHYDALRDLVLDRGCPPPSVVARVLDKRRTLEAAARVGLSVPHTLEIDTIAALNRARPQLRFPLIAKPRDHESRHGFNVKHFRSFDELAGEFARDETFGSRNLLQEFFPGRGVGVSVLIHRGKPITMFEHIRLREYPAAGGVSVLAESEPVTPMLAAAATSILADLGWEGVAMVEFRRGDGDAWRLMEVNGRYWGSVALALRAGVDFPYYQWQIAHGYEPAIPASYRTGIRTRWFSDDVRRLARLMLTHRDNMYATNRPRELLRFMSDFNARTSSAFGSWRDPLPRIAEPLDAVRQTLWSAAKRLARAAFPNAYTRAQRVRSIGYASAASHERRRLFRALGGRARHFRPKGVESVLFVCHGNIMRSPMAAAILRRELDGHASKRIESAGLHAVPGRHADPVACAIAAEMGIELGDHVAKPISRELVSEADAIFVMDGLNETEILTRYPEISQKLYLLGSIGGVTAASELEISDPYGCASSEVRACFERVAARVVRLAVMLQACARAS